MKQSTMLPAGIERFWSTVAHCYPIGSRKHEAGGNINCLSGSNPDADVVQEPTTLGWRWPGALGSIAAQCLVNPSCNFECTFFDCPFAWFTPPIRRKSGPPRYSIVYN